ncbi:hypothetical protein HPB49_004860 [Dermacentor silvarum]|uniref:Uncharacterized protein n=1 Tax=Dermacentor silvarum TaxID=543639 RepID=A0ACB8CV26_DERSI|nr:hypothetical protein HPB49_004860 [Dermacentor silvarum]
MNHIWLVKLRTKADKDALVKTGGLQVKGGFCAVIDPIQQDVTMKVYWVDFAVQNESFRQVLSNFGDVLEVSNDNWSVAGFEHATSTTRVVRMRLNEGVVLDDLPHLFKFGSGTVLLVAPGRNIKEHVGEVQETDAKKAGGTMPDSQDLTKTTEERAETVCTPEAALLSQASEEEDMSDCTETTTEEEKADATGATAARGKRLRSGIPKLTEDSTEPKVKRLERQWQRVAGAKANPSLQHALVKSEEEAAAAKAEATAARAEAAALRQRITKLEAQISALATGSAISPTPALTAPQP